MREKNYSHLRIVTPFGNESGTHPIDDDLLAEKLRLSVYDPLTRKLRLAVLRGSDQEADITLPSNCEGLGRVHHFRRQAFDDWPIDPLPMEPAAKALSLSPDMDMTAQVYQLAACNYRCWYCFVPYSLLHPTPRNSRLVSPDELIELYKAEESPPRIIDCSGGHPDLVPEWIPGMMVSLYHSGLADRTFLWSDDNLSNYFFWQYLSKKEIETVISFRNYSRVGCFKGFSAESFSFNTKAHPSRFERQFDVFRRLVMTGVDMFAYVTLTGQGKGRVVEEIREFVDRLQDIHPKLPLRTVPLKILPFKVMHNRKLNSLTEVALETQLEAVDAWNNELIRRFRSEELARPITDWDLREKSHGG